MPTTSALRRILLLSGRVMFILARRSVVVGSVVRSFMVFTYKTPAAPTCRVQMSFFQFFCPILARLGASLPGLELGVEDATHAELDLTAQQAQ